MNWIILAQWQILAVLECEHSFLSFRSATVTVSEKPADGNPTSDFMFPKLKENLLEVRGEAL